RDGLTDAQVAHNIGIAVGTLYEWKKRYPEFDEALKRGKVVVDREVENALLKRALGFEYEETETIVEDDGHGNSKRKVRRIQKKAVPDTTAAIFWLKNRKPAEWRDRINQEHSGGIQVNHQYEEMTDEELKELAEKYGNAIEKRSEEG